MGETDELIESARPILIEAVNLDLANQSNDALNKYMEGINKLDRAIKLLKRDDSRREALYKQISQYITRAENLKSKTKIKVQFLEQRRILADSTGHGYDKVFGKCIDDKLTTVHVQDAYIVAHHQILNFVRFCELLVTQAKNFQSISLLTGTAAEANKVAFTELGQSLESRHITFKIRDYNNKLFAEAEKIVMEEFPRKVIEYDELLTSHRFSYARLSEVMPNSDLNIPIPVKEDSIDEAPPAKKRKGIDDGEAKSNDMFGMPVYGFINGTVPCNDKLADLMDEVRPLLRDAVENVNKVKMWITLLIPRIEDGNNFGVSIQEETLGEVRNVESEAASFLDQMSRYFTSRGKLLTKVAKYPHVDDYRRAIFDMDEKQFINIRLVILEMRNHFSTLHDMITKNIEKIKRPRNSNMDHLY
uniref:MIT domain-containing protein n=1 Tax=Heterorhabditis bacteriophora TaxID=37862 RepID=A0A1I7XCP8_HETBA